MDPKTKDEILAVVNMIKKNNIFKKICWSNNLYKSNNTQRIYRKLCHVSSLEE